jgi:dephospho-CoA kinase
VVTAGLTGGIATGKSTVADFFARIGAVIVDADVIARKVVGKNAPAWHEIVRYFGPQVLLPNGEVDRVRLADIIFGDRRHRARLNRIVHPHVLDEIERRLRHLKTSGGCDLAIVDVPLLIEAGMAEKIGPVILVYAPEKVQMQRLMERDGLSHAQARSRLRAQMPIETKKKWADYIIDNSRSRAHTRRQTHAVYRRLLTLDA